MGEAKKRNDRMQEHVGVILRNRNKVLDDFVRAYLASVAATPEEQADLEANPSRWIAEKVEMVDVLDTKDPKRVGHIVFFRPRGPHRDEMREILERVRKLILLLADDDLANVAPAAVKVKGELVEDLLRWRIVGL